MVESKPKVLAHYYHSDAVPTFKRRTYVEINAEYNNHVVVVHYLDNNKKGTYEHHPHNCTCMGCTLYFSDEKSVPIHTQIGDIGIFDKDFLMNDYDTPVTVESIPIEELTNICVKDVAPCEIYSMQHHTKIIICLCQRNGSPLQTYYPFEKCSYKVKLMSLSLETKIVNKSIALDATCIIPGVIVVMCPPYDSVKSMGQNDISFNVQIEVNGFACTSTLLNVCDNSQKVSFPVISYRTLNLQSDSGSSSILLVDDAKAKGKGKTKKRKSVARTSGEQPSNVLDINDMGEDELSEMSEVLLEEAVTMLIEMSREEKTLSNELDSLDTNGYNLLHYTVMYNHMRLVRLLLKHGASVGTATKAGDTALHLAAENGYRELSKLLLSKGASVFALNENNETSYRLAKRNGHLEVVKLFEEYIRINEPRLAVIPEPEYNMDSIMDGVGDGGFGNSSDQVFQMESGDPNSDFSRFSLPSSGSELEFGSSPPKREREREDKHTALLREALSSMSLKDRCALSLGMAKRASISSTFPDSLSRNMPRRNRVDSEADVQSIVSENEEGLYAAMSAMHADERAELEQEATIIQKNFRKWMLRNNIESSRRAQSATKETLARARASVNNPTNNIKELDRGDTRLEEQATKVQAIGKGFLARRDYKQARQDVVQVQAAIRARLARREFWKLRRHVNSILTIQRVVRANLINKQE